MRLPRVRFTIGRMMVAIAVATVLAYSVVLPTWRYYRLPAKTRAVLTKLDRTVQLPVTGTVPLTSVLKAVRSASAGPKYAGVPIYVDPIGLSEAGATIESTVEVASERRPIKDQLKRSLKPLRLSYYVKDGLLMITSAADVDRELQDHPESARRP